MNIIDEFAPAKINLYLHITGRRPDGYHELDSLVGFASIGDEVSLRPADTFSFKITGPYAAELAHENPESNLAVKAARSLAGLTENKLDFALTLNKELPVASGIGGGSSDAAAVLRALVRYWNLPPNDARVRDAALRHGQDVPVCLEVENNYMTATGVIASPRLPCVDIVLINPGKALPTPDVFKEYRASGADFSPLNRLTDTPRTATALAEALKLRHNDLYGSACRLLPEVATVIGALQTTPHCLLARMSGSGATCFGLYTDVAAAAMAVAQIRAAHPRWWVEAGVLNA